jgi:hypothetical protein
MMHSTGLGDQPRVLSRRVEMKTQQRKQKSEEKVDLELHFGEKPFVLFEADILAAEDFARIYRSRPLSPERELMVAVLEEALADYQRCWKARDKKGMERFADAQAWILESDSEWIGIEPDYLRQGLLRWNQAKRAKLLSAPAIPQQKHQPKRLRQAA